MAKNKQHGVDKDGLPPRGRTMEQQKRIDDAREHYRTRADRRPKGQSQADMTKYVSVSDSEVLLRRVPRVTLQLVHDIYSDN